MSFTRSAGYRTSLTKGRPAPVTAPAALAEALGEVAPEVLDEEPESAEAEELAEIAEPAAVLASYRRAVLPAASEVAASRDPAFRALVAAGDGHRDAGAWAKAEASYGAALALYPYQPGYWVQQGHMRKEQSHFAGAEIAYRTAAALGAAPDGVTEHLRFVMAKQDLGQDGGEASHPIRFAGPGTTAQLVPSQPDVLLLARLLWRTHTVPDKEMLAFLREAESLDALFAAMVADTRFAQANVQWLSVMQDGDIA